MAEDFFYKFWEACIMYIFLHVFSLYGKSSKDHELIIILFNNPFLRITSIRAHSDYVKCVR
jgi:hypothetical protein